MLLGIDDLPTLRRRIEARQLSGDDAVRSISRADCRPAVGNSRSRTPPSHRRYRAPCGTLQPAQRQGAGGPGACRRCPVLRLGRSDAGHQQRLVHLIDAQERNFQLFADFADSEAIAQWQALEASRCIAPLERFRRILCSTRPGEALNAEISDQWFDICSERLTGIMVLVKFMVVALQRTCSKLIIEAERDLADAEGLLARLVQHPPASADRVDRFFDPSRPHRHGHELSPAVHRTPESMEQSIIDVLQAQSVRLASVESELQAARRAPDERKLIERAKGVLMARPRVSEEKAYKALRDASMSQNRRIADVAEATLALPISSARAASRTNSDHRPCCIAPSRSMQALFRSEMPHITA